MPLHLLWCTTTMCRTRAGSLISEWARRNTVFDAKHAMVLTKNVPGILATWCVNFLSHLGQMSTSRIDFLCLSGKELCKPIIHISFLPHIVRILRCICFSCSKLLCNKVNSPTRIQYFFLDKLEMGNPKLFYQIRKARTSRRQ